jgi:subtilisin family serine protease
MQFPDPTPLRGEETTFGAAGIVRPATGAGGVLGVTRHPGEDVIGMAQHLTSGRGARLVVAVTLVVSLAAAMLATTAMPSGAQQAAASGTGPAEAPVSEEVTAAIAEQGHALVVANLAAPADSPAAVGATAQSVIDGLPEGSFEGQATAQDLPFVSLKVDAAGLDALKASPEVTSVVLDHVNTPSLMVTVPAVGGDVARDEGYDGAGTAVAIVDTGVQYYHPFLADDFGNSRVVSEVCFSGAAGAFPSNVFSLCPGFNYTESGLGSSFPCNGLTGTLFPSPCGHGTHVAGIAAGRAITNDGVANPRYGVASKASILSANVFSLICDGSITPTGGCTTGFVFGALDSDIARALNWVDTQRATYNVASVNVSVGGSTHYSSACDGNTSVAGPITNLRNHGVATVVASGNESSKTGISSPACVSTAISVGSWDPVTNSVSSFSNSAAILTLLAPGARNGAGIRSSVPSSTPPYSGYAGFAGTSMAAPHVAGAIAALHQLHPAFSVSQLLSLLTSTGTGVTDPGNSITKPRIQLDLALASAATVPGAPTAVTGAAVDSQATVSWVPPLSGGSPITSYTASVSPGGQTCTWTTGPLGCTITGLTNNVPYTFSVHATNTIGDGPESASSSSVLPATPYVPLVPARIMDTRAAPAGQTVDHQFESEGPILPGRTRDLTVVNRGGVPLSGASAVVLNVTAVGSSSDGYLTVYPTGVSTPNASNLNFRAGQVIANMAVVQVGTGGQITISNPYGSTPVIVDVVGYYPAGSLYTPIVPARFLDTRSPPAGQTFDGVSVGGGSIAPGATTTFTVTGRGPIPASGVGSVVLNVTVAGSSSDGYLTVYPAGVATPNASNVNFSAGQVIANMAVVKVGAGGQITIKNPYGSTPVIVDVVGWFPTGGGENPLVPARLMDTRPVPSGATIDGQFRGTGALAPGESRTLTVIGRGGVPFVGASAVALNVTVAGSSGSGYLTVYPTGVSTPNASNINFTAGQVIPNMVIVKVGANGQITISNPFGSTPVIVDVVGWFP